jgi:hypothetical protein
MLRILAATLAAFCVLGGARAACAQAARPWNDARTRELVERATERRAQQLADTGLVDYRATARGYLTFLAQLGAGFTEPPRIVKADQLALEVYWRAPDLSKQRIIGRRDTLLLPTDINYHRDHLGIIQNNFPEIIRLGDGDEVQDVPHPLSASGLREYDFAIRDSITIRLPDRTIEVLEVVVRPKDERQPRAVGAVYIDRAGAQVVRMAFGFTRVALKDEQLDDVSVVLENALVGDRFWLPSRQEIEIRRSGTWLDYPARGIIRGRWEICCYELNKGFDPRAFAGPEIVQAPRREMAEYPWPGRVLDSLPSDVRAVTDEEVARVQEEARALVRAQALARARRPALSARGLSDLVRVNRAEGLALGAGIGRRMGGGITAAVSGRWGFADHEAKGRASLAYERASGAGLRLSAYRAYREAGDVAEMSPLVNSFAAQELGSDRSDPFDARGAAVTLALGERLAARWTIEVARETQGALAVHARPARGGFEPTLPAWRIQGTRLRLHAERPTTLAWWGAELRAEAELRGLLFRGRDTVIGGGRPHAARVFASLQLERPVGAHRVVLHTTAAVVQGPAVPPQELVLLGGPVSAPGYAHHALTGRGGATQRAEWRMPVPFPSLTLGRFGKTPAAATLAPYAHVAVLARPELLRAGSEPAAPEAGAYPALGVALVTLFDVLRFDVARGLRDGRWMFSVDVARDFWSVL